MKKGTLIMISDDRRAELGLIDYNPFAVIHSYPNDYDRETRQHLAKFRNPITGKTFVARFTSKQIIKN